MAWSCCNYRLVSLGNLRLELVQLLQVIGHSLVILLILHAEQGAEIGAIAPLLALSRCHINGPCQSVLVERADASANFVSEGGRKRVESVLLIEHKDSQPAY